MIDGYSVADTTGPLEQVFLGFLYEDLVKDSDDLACPDVVKGASAVAGVGGRVQLEHVIGLIQPAHGPRVQALRTELGTGDRADGGNDAMVRDGIKA